MNFPLHAHQILIVATLTYCTSILTTDWHRSIDKNVRTNIFQICIDRENRSTCQWNFLIELSNQSIFKILPLIVSYLAVSSILFSVLGLIIGSCFIQKFDHDNQSRSILIITFVLTTISFLLCCSVWSIMLIIDLDQTNFVNIRLEDFGFSFWISIGASAGYLYSLLMYIVTICRNK